MKKRWIACLGTAVICLLISLPAWGLDAPAISAAAKGPNQINLRWGAVANPGYGYRVEIQSSADARYINWTDITRTQNGRNYLPYWVTESQYTDPLDASSGNGTACQYPVYGLKNNAQYNFRVRTYAKNDGGADVFSSYSATASATTANYSVRYVSPNGNDSNNGSSPSTPWRHIYYASQQASAGMVVYIMAGSYANDYIYANRSGSPTGKIVFQADPGSAPVITSGEYGGHTFWITGSFNVVDGLKANFGTYGGENAIISGSRNAVVNCDIGSVSGAYGTIFNVTGSYNLVHNNYLHDAGNGANGNDSGSTLACYGGAASNNVIQYNHMSRGAHDTGLVKNGASYIKWINNLHDGGWGLGWECVSDSGSSCMYNLFEGNEVASVQMAGNGTVYKPGIEVSGDYNTVRRNVIRSGYSHGIEVSYMSGSGTTNNLIYNNTIYGNGGAAVTYFTRISGNVLANNILYSNGLRNPYDNTAIEIFSYETTTIRVSNNLILHKSSSGVENPAFACIDWGATGSPRAVSYANANLSGFVNNITVTPSFISEAGADFHLKSTSGAVNTGTVVTDSIWGTITYKGAAPDIGAFEYSDPGSSGGTVSAPAAPRNFRITS